MSVAEELTRVRKSSTRKGIAAAPSPHESVPDARCAGLALGAATGTTPIAQAGAVTDALFRDTIVAAAAEVGFDGEGLDGLKGYLRKIADQDRKTYFGVLAKLIAPDAASETREPITKIERVIVRAKE